MRAIVNPKPYHNDDSIQEYVELLQYLSKGNQLFTSVQQT